jgi:hypothetical protein
MPDADEAPGPFVLRDNDIQPGQSVVIFGGADSAVAFAEPVITVRFSYRDVPSAEWPKDYGRNRLPERRYYGNGNVFDV